MSNEEYQILKIVHTLDEVNQIVKEHDVSKYRTSNLKNVTKYSHRCSHYRKYSLCRYEIQAYILDDNSHIKYCTIERKIQVQLLSTQLQQEEIQFNKTKKFSCQRRHDH